VVTVCAAAVFALSGCASDRAGPLVVRGLGVTATARTEPLPTAAAMAAVVRAVAKTLRTSALVHTEVAFRGTGTDVDLGPLPRTITAAGAYNFATRSGHLSVGISGGAIATIRERLFPRVVYFANLPSVRLNSWATVPRSTLRSHYLYRTAANDPSQVLGLVADAEQMAVDGQDVIAAADATRYRGYLSGAGLTRHLAPTAKQEVQLMQLLGPQARRVEVWVARDGRVVRVRVGFHATQGEQYVEESVQLDLSSFGAKVTTPRPATRTQVAVRTLAGVLLG
jgi:hypothetical protein